MKSLSSSDPEAITKWLHEEFDLLLEKIPEIVSEVHRANRAEISKSQNEEVENMKLNSRLESMQDEVDKLKARESMHNQLMENLRLAETEVDLLGDQVDSLLDLLKKIHTALDHYSPVLKHYPGINEILKLVKTELGGESKR